jgi:hypothetical protein
MSPPLTCHPCFERLHRDLAWEMLMEDNMMELRAYLFGNDRADVIRFRQVVVNIVHGESGPDLWLCDLHTPIQPLTCRIPQPLISSTRSSMTYASHDGQKPSAKALLAATTICLPPLSWSTLCKPQMYPIPCNIGEHRCDWQLRSLALRCPIFLVLISSLFPCCF